MHNSTFSLNDDRNRFSEKRHAASGKFITFSIIFLFYKASNSIASLISQRKAGNLISQKKCELQEISIKKFFSKTLLSSSSLRSYFFCSLSAFPDNVRQFLLAPWKKPLIAIDQVIRFCRPSFF